jgi:sugar fermentation stimulation protein A
MRFPTVLIPARFLRREKRFLVHVRFSDGREAIAHTNNTGSLKGCLAPDCRVWLSIATNPRRKLPWTLEIVEASGKEWDGSSSCCCAADINFTESSSVKSTRHRNCEEWIKPPLIGVNTILANRLVREGIETGLITELQGYAQIRSEVSYEGKNSRADFLLESDRVHTVTERAWVEVKNVTYVREGRALFPDAVTVRGRKHLAELSTRVAAGDRALLVFVVQRYDCHSVGPADAIDPAFGKALRQAVAAGVELLGYQAEVSPESIRLLRRLEVEM